MYMYEDNRREPVLRCPVCGSEELEEAFLNKDNEVVGCNICLKRQEVWDVPDCYLDNDRWHICIPA